MLIIMVTPLPSWMLADSHDGPPSGRDASPRKGSPRSPRHPRGGGLHKKSAIADWESASGSEAGSKHGTHGEIATWTRHAYGPGMLRPRAQQMHYARVQSFIIEKAPWSATILRVLLRCTGHTMSVPEAMPDDGSMMAAGKKARGHELAIADEDIEMDAEEPSSEDVSRCGLRSLAPHVHSSEIQLNSLL